MYIKLLYEFEQKERNLRVKEARIKEIDQELQIKNEIDEIQNQIAGLNSAIEGFISRKNELERDIEENNDQLKGITELLEGNKLKTSKEIKAAKKTKENLETKSEELKKNLEFTETAIGEKKSQIEDLEKQIADLEKGLKDIRKERKNLESQIKNETAELKKEFNKIAKEIPGDILTKYEEIKESFPYGAISSIEDDACSNCGAVLPLEVLEELKESKGEKLIRCEVCGKILYFPDET